jgi:hypothetical protein
MSQSRLPQHLTDVPCRCGVPEQLSRDDRYPIVFDSTTGEYQLASYDGHWRHQMYHCLWCGGRLPSTRQDLFTEPDAAEAAGIQDLLRAAASVPDVLRILGVPDNTYECSESGGPGQVIREGGSARRQTRVYQYTTRWKSLDLHILEYSDGFFSYAISGKYRGGRPSSRGERRRWRFWDR